MIFNFVYIVEAGRSVIAAARFYPPPYCRTEKTDSLLRKSSFAEFRPDKRSPPDTDISQQCCLRLLTFLDLAAAIGRQQVLQVVDLHLQLLADSRIAHRDAVGRRLDDHLRRDDVLSLLDGLANCKSTYNRRCPFRNGTPWKIRRRSSAACRRP